MQVKKFESDSLRGAIEMVKNELGPDAVILSTREVARGVLSRPHVLVTAAISEAKLEQKKLAERKIGEQNVEKFRKTSAVNQREVINKIYGSVTEKIEKKRAAISSRPYISISDDEAVESTAVAVPRTIVPAKVLQAPEPMVPQISNLAPTSMDRIKNAAKEAFKANVFGEERKVEIQDKQVRAGASKEGSQEINQLKSEIQRLQSMIEGIGQKKPDNYSTSMHPGARYGLPFELSSMFERLRKQGIHEQLCASILKKMGGQFNPAEIAQPRVVESYVAKWLLSTTSTVSDKEMDRIEFSFWSKRVRKDVYFS